MTFGIVPSASLAFWVQTNEEGLRHPPNAIQDFADIGYPQIFFHTHHSGCALRRMVLQ